MILQTITKKTKRKKQYLKKNYSLDIAIQACKAIEEKKGENILLLDVSRLTVISDYFLFVTANSSSQIHAISNHIEETLTKLNYRLVSKEGLLESNWIILDYGEVVIHIMNEEIRNYYKLERFWSNGRVVKSKIWSDVD